MTSKTDNSGEEKLSPAGIKSCLVLPCSIGDALGPTRLDHHIVVGLLQNGPSCENVEPCMASLHHAPSAVVQE